MKKKSRHEISDTSVACGANSTFRVETFTLKVFDDDGKVSMSGRYGIIMYYFAEVGVQRLIKKVFPSPMVYRILLGGTDGPNDTGSILSTIFGRI